MENKIDFEGLAHHLLYRIRELLPAWLPGGAITGHEYSCGDLRGGQGKSCKVNITSGKWADFSSTEKGGDLISLYAAIQGIKNMGDAARTLAQDYNYVTSVAQQNPVSTVSQSVQRETVCLPPDDAPQPAMKHPKHGLPVNWWAYLNYAGKIMFYMARYETGQGKEFLPWSWDGQRWQCRGWPAPRPLYGLERLSISKPQTPVLIVEGEKTAMAAAELLGMHYVVVTWPNGAKAVSKADWTPIHGRRVLIWPDADEPGETAAREIAQILTKHCPEIKIIEAVNAQDHGKPVGWDAADALAQGWDTARTIDWARERVQVFNITVNNPVNIEQQTIVNVPATAPEDTARPPSESMYATWERLGLALTGQGHPICNEDNVIRIFEGEEYLHKTCWFDDFHNSIMLDGKKWLEIDTINFMVRLQRHYGMSRISDATIWRAIMYVANRDHRNEPLDWMNTLVWDQRPRIDKFFVSHFGAKPTLYVDAASKNFWVSMVARVHNPGCIMRSMVILKSKQLAGKSTAFSLIGGPWYCEALENIQSNNFLQSLHGNLLVEFGDMAGMDRADVNRIKQIISCRKDRFRSPYERLPSDHLRQCILVASTNESNFLRDDTGGTRFWPIETTKIDHEAIIRDRDQLFAEAVARLKAGENWHIMPSEETELVQESYRQNDEWEGIIAEFLNQPNLYGQEVTVAQIAADCIKIPLDRLDKSTQMRIGRNLSIIGFEKFNKRSGHSVVKVWKRVVKVSNEAYNEVETW